MYYIFYNSVTRLLVEMKWTPLEERRARCKVSLVHRAINDDIKIPVEHFKMNPNRTRSGGKSYSVPRSRTNTHMNSFYPSSIRLWNSLPENIKNGSQEMLKKGFEGHTIRSQYVG